VAEESVMAMLRSIILCFLGVIWSGLVYADHADETSSGDLGFSQLSLPNLYPEPQVPTPRAGDSLKTCVALDDEIVGLTPLTYRTTPDIYDDPKVAAAIWLGTTNMVLLNILPEEIPLTDIPLAYAYLAYPAYKGYKEEERIRRVSLRIESLRRIKARKRCFET